MSGKNLFSIQLDYLVAPKRVLKDQAEHISQLSNETILARVETARGSQGMDDCFTHTFHIRVPKLSYTAQLFEVTHGIDMYPVQVRNDDWSFEKDCPDAASFQSAVGEILNSPATKLRLEALRSQAFAEMEDPPPIDYDNGSSAVVTEERPDEIEPSDEEPVVETPVDPDAESEVVEEVQEDNDSDVDAILASNHDEDVSEPLDSEEDYFEEWGDPIEFDTDSIAACPDQFGAAIIYTNDGSPLFIICAKKLKTALKRQLGRKASPYVSKSRKSGLMFVCGSARSIDEAEQIVESRINTMPFRAMLGDGDASDWL